MPDSYPVLFERGLAQALHDAALGLYKGPTGVITAAEATLATPGISTNGELPTTYDNAIVINTLAPIREGRADLVHRIQILSRLKGTKVQAKNLAWAIGEFLDHQQNIPAGFNVSWIDLFSELPFTADASNRYSTAQTFYFRGRRPIV